MHAQQPCPLVFIPGGVLSSTCRVRDGERDKGEGERIRTDGLSPCVLVLRVILLFTWH